MGIGDKLNQLLIKRNRNINELSVAIGVSPQTLYSISKRNNTKVDLDVLQKIADELSVTLDYFCTDESQYTNQSIFLSDIEKKIILAYRKHIELQPAINKMLDVQISGTSVRPVRIAAKGQGTFEKTISDEQRKRAAAALHNMQDEE